MDSEEIIKFYIITINSNGNLISKSGKLTTWKNKSAKSNYVSVCNDIIKQFNIKEYSTIFYHIEDYNNEDTLK